MTVNFRNETLCELWENKSRKKAPVSLWTTCSYHFCIKNEKREKREEKNKRKKTELDFDNPFGETQLESAFKTRIWNNLVEKKRFPLFKTTILSCVHVSIAVLYFSFLFCLLFFSLWFQTGLCDSVVCSCFLELPWLPMKQLSNVKRSSRIKTYSTAI